MATKLVDTTELDNNLTSIANAIRAKSGTEDQLAFPSGFVSAVEGISSGIIMSSIFENTRCEIIRDYNTHIKNLNNWIFQSKTGGGALFSCNYNESTGVNTVSYTGGSGFERLIFAMPVSVGSAYTFGFTLEHQQPLTYWNTNMQYEYAFVGKKLIGYYDYDIDQYSGSSYADKYSKTENYQTSAGSQNLSCTFVPTADFAYIYIDFGQLEDGKEFIFKISNIYCTKLS